MTELILSGRFEVVEILKPTKRKVFNRMVVGDVFSVQSTIHRQGSSSGRKHAIWLDVIFQGDIMHSYSYTELDNIFRDIMVVKQF